MLGSNKIKNQKKFRLVFQLSPKYIQPFQNVKAGCGLADAPIVMNATCLVQKHFMFLCSCELSDHFLFRVYTVRENQGKTYLFRDGQGKSGKIRESQGIQRKSQGKLGKSQGDFFGKFLPPMNQDPLFILAIVCQTSLTSYFSLYLYIFLL